MSSPALALVPVEPRPANALIRPVIAPAQVLALHEDVAQMVQQTLKEGQDFGTIPGTKKPSMYKAGAERLCVGFGLVDRYEIIATDVNHDFPNSWEKRDRETGEVYASGTALGLYRYSVKCSLYRREDMVLVAEGIGSCSTLESKYCDRPRDCENTVLKMAKKRAKVDATLTGLGLSDRFTQDVEDMDIGGGGAAREDAEEKGVLGVDFPACPKCGGRMWDNRKSKKNPKAPDYKCRTTSCDGLFWPGAWHPNKAKDEKAAGEQAGGEAASANGTAKAESGEVQESVHGLLKQYNALLKQGYESKALGEVMAKQLKQDGIDHGKENTPANATWFRKAIADLEQIVGINGTKGAVKF